MTEDLRSGFDGNDDERDWIDGEDTAHETGNGIRGTDGEFDWRDEEVDEDAESESRRRERFFETAQRRERVILVGVSRPPDQQRFETDEHLDELELLTETAGAEVVEKVFQSRGQLVPATFIGKGKAQYIAERCEDADVQTVIFDDDLTPVQQRNLERIFNRKVIDRTTLILDIFAQHARTSAARTQVELAQLEYLLPRLTRMWTHLSKQYGGIGTKGPGETQIETDRRILRDRIAHLKSRLARIDRQRATQRQGRRDVTRVSLVGYTNVGKSTLLNILTGADVLAENKLFATLDSTVRGIELGRNTVLLSDTVGFIRKLPTRLIASFKSTLDEVSEADIILHVIDIAHPHFREQITVVQDTLKELHADGKPTVHVFNKIDAIDRGGEMQGLREQYPRAVFISAQRGINLGELRGTLQDIVEEQHREKTFIIAPPDYRISAELHRNSTILEEVFEEDHIRVRCVIPPDVEQRMLKSYPDTLTLSS
jgi:GTP-binding protein HflX